MSNTKYQCDAGKLTLSLSPVSIERCFGAYRVAEETDDVEVYKVHGEALDGFPSPIENDLWIEGGGPGDEVSPTDEVGEEGTETTLG